MNLSAFLKIVFSLFVLTFLLFTIILPISQRIAFANPGVEIIANKTNAIPGEQIQIVISVKGTQNASEPEFPMSDTYDLYFNGRSSRVEIINSQFNASLDFNYVLIPKKQGKITIPPIAVNTGKDKEFTQPLTITVSAAPSQPQGIDTTDKIFLTAEVDDKEPFVNQQIIYILRFYTMVRIQNASIEQLMFDGFQSEKLGKEREYQQTLKGKNYTVTEIRFALFPQKSGTLTIPSTRLQCQVLYKRARGRGFPFDSFFDDSFFGGYEAKKEFFSTQPITVNVKPLPVPEDKDLATSLVGDFTISADLNPQQLKVGDSATLTVTVSGKGNVRSLPDPKTPDIPEFKTYEDKPQFNISTTLDGISGVKTFKRAIVPTMAGKFQIPAIKFPYLDPQKGQYRVASTQPISLTVLPGSEEKLNLVEGERNNVKKEEIKLLGKDILPQKTAIVALKDQSVRIFHPFLFLLFIAPPLTYLSLFFWEKKKHHLKTDRAYYRRKKALRVWKKKIHTIHFLKDTSEKIYYSHLSNGLKQFLGDRLDVTGRALTPQEIEEMLQGHTVPEDLRKSLKEHLQTLEMGEFGALHQDAEQKKALLESIDTLIGQLIRWI